MIMYWIRFVNDMWIIETQGNVLSSKSTQLMYRWRLRLIIFVEKSVKVIVLLNIFNYKKYFFNLTIFPICEVSSISIHLPPVVT